jgi:ABC-type branched-subunit amino acid transport system ATPase component
MAQPFGHITANLNVIYPRYDPAKFVGRGWLVDEVARFRDNEHRQHMMIVGEPGSGKSTFTACLAETWNCTRNFIRADNVAGVTGVDPRAFLISMGAQLCQKYGPEIFVQGKSTKTRVIVGLAKDQAEVVGRMIEEMYTLPFLSQL